MPSAAITRQAKHSLCISIVFVYRPSRQPLERKRLAVFFGQSKDPPAAFEGGNFRKCAGCRATRPCYKLLSRRILTRGDPSDQRRQAGDITRSSSKWASPICA